MLAGLSICRKTSLYECGSQRFELIANVFQGIFQSKLSAAYVTGVWEHQRYEEFSDVYASCSWLQTFCRKPRTRIWSHQRYEQFSDVDSSGSSL